MISVSPFHQIELDESLLPMLDRPPEKDFVIRRLSQKSVNGQPLIQGELVISGAEALREYPLAQKYPVHFRKTYYPICFHQNPAGEYQNHLAASRIIPVPPPIGSTRTTFRSCFFPGRPYSALSPFGAEPEEQNIAIGQRADTAALIGLWNLLSQVYEQVSRLHENDFLHGDLFLHNVIVSPSPIGVHLIDFEQSIQRSASLSEAEWEERKNAELREILREAVCLQCALGNQPGPLGETALSQLSDLVGDPGRFARAMKRTESSPL